MFEFLIAAVFICAPALFQQIGMIVAAQVTFIITMVIGALFFAYVLYCYSIARKDEWVTMMTRYTIVGALTLIGIGLAVFLAIRTGII